MGQGISAVYALSAPDDTSPSTPPSDTVSWARTTWMSRIDGLTAGRALGRGMVLAGVNPKNLILTAGAAAGLAQLGLSAADAIVSLLVFVGIGSLTIAGPVAYRMAGGEDARARLDTVKIWLIVHSGAVMPVLLLVFGASP